MTVYKTACTGASNCPEPLHVHGCYTDMGNCDDPGDHAPAGRGQTGGMTVLCSVMHCQLPAVYAQQVSLAHGMGHALICVKHGPHPGDRDGVVGVDSYLDFTGTQPTGSASSPTPQVDS